MTYYHTFFFRPAKYMTPYISLMHLAALSPQTDRHWGTASPQQGGCSASSLLGIQLAEIWEQGRN